MKVTKRKVPKAACSFAEDSEFNLQFSENDLQKLEAFSMTAYSGKIIKNHWMWGDLAIDVEGITAAQSKLPILEQHDSALKLGYSTKPDISGKTVFFPQIKLLDNEDADKFAKNLISGFPYQASLSVRPSLIEEFNEGETAEVNGYKMKGPGTIFRKSILKEASACVFGYDPKTSVTPLSEEEEMEVEFLSLSEDKKPKKKIKYKQNGGSYMFEHLKEENLELYNQITTALAEEDTKVVALTAERDGLTTQVTDLTGQVTSLTEDKKTLTDEGKESEKRIAKLEEAENARVTLALEKNREDKAKGIIDASFSEHNISERVQKKIRKYMSFSEYVKDGALDETAFSKYVDEEVKDWKKDLGDSVIGLGDNHNDEDEMTEQKADDLADSMVALAYPNKDKK